MVRQSGSFNTVAFIVWLDDNDFVCKFFDVMFYDNRDVKRAIRIHYNAGPNWPRLFLLC